MAGHQSEGLRYRDIGKLPDRLLWEAGVRLDDGWLEKPDVAANLSQGDLTLLYIPDDSTGAKIADATVQAAKECARMIGKIGPEFTAEHFEAMEKEVMALFRAIAERKKRGASDHS